jgi:hypothetical protein
MGELVEQAPELRLEAPVRSNVCCFGADLPDGADPGPLNAAIAQRLQLDGDAVFSTTTVGGRTVIRGAIVNHRTQGADVEAAIAAARAACRALGAR